MNINRIEYLPWDSDFFGFKIGRIIVEKTDNIVNILEIAKLTNYQLIYLFGDASFFVEDEILGRFNGLLADRKIVYLKEIKIKNEPSSFVSEYRDNKLSSEIEQLAYESGKYSRFKLDNHFRKDSFYQMYKVWIENSIKKQIADNVFITIVDNSIKGVVTLKIDDKKGQIGLLAVSPNMQGKSHGKSLINICENELLSKGISKLEVTTQINNKQACTFYEKCGFKIKEITNIYHFWL